MAVLIKSEELGVFLGVAMGLAFWSKLDPVGQDCAVTFTSEKDAVDFMATWESKPEDVSFVECVPDRGDYASIKACMTAGCEPWLGEQTPTANELPA